MMTLNFSNFSYYFRYVVLLVLFCNSSVYSQNEVYWTDVDLGRIMKSDINGLGVETVLSSNIPEYLVADSLGQKIYWTDNGTKSINSKSYDGSDYRELVSNLDGLKGLTIGPDSNLYVIVSNSIQVFSKNGQYISTVLENLAEPSDVVVGSKFLFWGDVSKNTIERSSLNGLQKETLIESVYSPRNLRIDHQNGNIYWTQSSALTSRNGIFRSDFDGQNLDTIAAGLSVSGIELDAESGVLYFSRSGRIQKLDLLTAEQEVLVESLERPGRISIDYSNNKIFFVNFDYGKYLYSANLEDGSSQKTIGANLVYRPIRMEFDTINKKMYWVNSKTAFINDNSGAIMRSNYDGSEVEQILSYPIAKRPFGLALDVTANKMYWTDQTIKGIYYSDLNGNNSNILIDGGNYINPQGIFLDKMNEKLYWTSFPNLVTRCDLDGSNIENVLPNDIGFTTEVLVSNKLNRIFWTDGAARSIYSSNLDGEDVKFHVRSDDTLSSYINSFYVDEINDIIYFVQNGANDKIGKVNINGENIEFFDINTLLNPGDIEILNPSLITSLFTNPTKDEGVKIYPNPFINEVNVECEVRIESIILANAIGQNSYFAINGFKARINIPKKFSNSYIIAIIKLESGNSIVKKLMSM